MCIALAHVRFGPEADIGYQGNFSASDQLSGTRQDNPDLGELAGPCINFDYACVLFHDDVVADREPKSRALSSWLGCEERLEHLFLHVRSNTCPVIADSDFNTIAKVFGRRRKGRLVVATVSLCSASGRSIEAVCNQI